ncbi:MAG: indolepyruvate oxidoreductase subunit beta family protein [Xanthobacteraceae bacterium]
MSIPSRPLTLLIAALGGEGGGVLTNWIISAATKLGFPVQSTSVPGVAQRTGATTYYIEMLPVAWSDLDGQTPVFGLVPGVGDVDVVVASELLEAGRAIANGFVTPDRTFVIASGHRQYAISEKMAMADGRYDPMRLLGAVAHHAQAALIFDMDAVARESGAMINAVMLGALVASKRLPIPQDALREAIRADGKAAEANLRGFEAGLKAGELASEEPVFAAPTKRLGHSARRLRKLEAEVNETFPAEAAAVAVEGIRRLYRYQNRRYAKTYVARLKPIAEADTAFGANGRLLRETARHLAVRMSYEDVIRVAAAKIAPDRIARIREDLGAKPGERLRIFEFLKPGLDEMCQIMPPWLARRVLHAAEKSDRLRDLHFTMEIETTSVFGFLRLWWLAKLRMFRPWTNRYQEEQRAIEDWLVLVNDAAPHSPALSLEIAACAQLLKGYGDTLRRGRQNYQEIESRVIRPVLAGQIPLETGIDAVASARTAALTDPEGESLANCLAEVERNKVLALAAE